MKKILFFTGSTSILIICLWLAMIPRLPVTIKNTMHAELATISISFPGNEKTPITISPNTKKTIWIKPEGDGILKIKIKSKNLNNEFNIGYVTRNSPIGFYIEIGPNGVSKNLIKKKSVFFFFG